MSMDETITLKGGPADGAIVRIGLPSYEVPVMWAPGNCEVAVYDETGHFTHYRKVGAS